MVCGECRSLPDSCDCEPLPLAAEPGKRPGRQIVLTKASKIDPEPVVWAWEEDGAGRIPAGSVGLFAGREGTGKSSFLIWLTARITTGMLPGSLDGPRSVIYVAVEDSWKYTIVPRLIASGADLDRVYRAEVQQVIKDTTVSLSLPMDNELLEKAITGNDVAMVALDPLMSAISDALDTHVNRQVRQALDPLARLADRTGAVIAGIAHFGKSAGTDASSLITGSGAFKDVARFIFAFATDPEDGTQVITQTKNSLGLSNLPSLDYRIIEAVVPTPKGDAKVGKFVPGGVTEKTVHDILAAQGSGDLGEKQRAQDYLRKALGERPRPSKEVEEEAQQAHGITKRTLDRARADLGITAEKCGKEWYISLPEHEGDLKELKERLAAQTPKDAKNAKPGNVGMDAKDAKPALKGEVGTLGILPEASADVLGALLAGEPDAGRPNDVTTFAGQGKGPAPDQRRPPDRQTARPPSPSDPGDVRDPSVPGQGVRHKGYIGNDAGQPGNPRFSASDTSDTSVTSVTGLTCEVTDVTDVSDTPPGMCKICGEPLDQALTAAGFTDHGEGEAANPDPADRKVLDRLARDSQDRLIAEASRHPVGPYAEPHGP